MGIRDLSTADLRAELAHRLRGIDSDDSCIIVPGSGGCTEETLVARLYGIMATESEEMSIRYFYTSETEANEDLVWRQELDPEEMGSLSEHHVVVRVDAILSIWNSTDADPFEPPDCNGHPPFTIRTVDDAWRAVARKAVG